MSENITAPEKCVTLNRLLINHLSRELFLEQVLPWPICLGHGDPDHDQKNILELDVSQGGGRGPRDVFPDQIDTLTVLTSKEIEVGKDLDLVQAGLPRPLVVQTRQYLSSFVTYDSSCQTGALFTAWLG